MKIVEENASRLILRDFPVFSVACCILFLTSLIAVLAMNPAQFVGPKRFLIAGGGVFVALMLVSIAKKTDVVLDRALDCFTLTRRGLFGAKTFHCGLTDISSVGVQELPGVKPTDHFRRVAVLANQQWIPLTGYWHIQKDDCQRISKAIKSFLHPAVGVANGRR